MRERVRDWQMEWAEEYGRTDALEVLICDRNGTEFYSGSFKDIPERELDKKVIDGSLILDSSIPERIGAIRITV